ncbi:MAG: bifunctional nuclease family protein [Myxococcota bacterium]
MRRWLVMGILAASLGAQGAQPSVPKPPKESVALHVDKVAPTGDGHVVFLTDDTQGRIVPITVGESEAIAIAFRLADRKPDRPLTHDLLEQALRGLGGEVVQVHVHTLTEGVFHARVTVRQKHRQLHLDARASDAIALALGPGLPIYMSADLYEETGVSMSELFDSLRRLDGPEGVPLRPPP